MQFRDLKKQYEALKPEIDAGIREVIDGTAFILGKQVAELESRLAAYTGRKYCVSCGNGTDALVLALRAHDVGPGDAVFVPDFTYIASANCAALIGATPVFTDIDSATFNMDPAALEAAVERTLQEGRLRPRAVIPVDLFGLPADFDAIGAIAKKYNLLVLEDAAQGFGGSIRGRRACSFGDISATSFFPAKPLGCYGDGGAIFTDDGTVAERLRSIRAGGKSPTDKYDNREVGTNSRLDTLQAAILLPKLRAFEEYELENVNRAAGWYTERLKGRVVTPYIPEGYRSGWAQYTIRLKDTAERDAVQTKLKQAGIPSMIYYPRGMHAQQAFQYMHLPEELFPNTAAAVKTVLSLPIHPYLEEVTVESICGIITGATAK